MLQFTTKWLQLHVAVYSKMASVVCSSLQVKAISIVVIKEKATLRVFTPTLLSCPQVHNHPLSVDDHLVKEEPQDYSEAEDTKESIQSADSDPSLNYSLPHGDHPAGLVGGEGAAPGFTPPTIRSGSQPQTMEDLVAQALPGASGLQGVSCH